MKNMILPKIDWKKFGDLLNEVLINRREYTVPFATSALKKE